MDKSISWVCVPCLNCHSATMYNPKAIKGREEVVCSRCGAKYNLYPGEDGKSIISDQADYYRPLMLTMAGERKNG